MTMVPLLLFCCITSVLSHGGIVFPPSWQDGDHLSIEEVYSSNSGTNPPVKDPNTGKPINYLFRWLTDQAYIGGHGTEEFRSGPGDVTNFKEGGCNKQCQRSKVPWAAPGKAPAFGGGCGVFGGNPYGCHHEKGGITVSSTHNDTRKPGSPCLNGGTFTFGGDARDIEFPEAAMTDWVVGSVQEVAWASKAWHQGGYTYRLCRMPDQGKIGLTEECFQKNILQFASDYTMVRKTGTENLGKWEKYEQSDVSIGTHPSGSVWRPAGKYVYGTAFIRKDEVKVPSHLDEGEYVLSFRWDGATKDGQVWLSCANVRIVAPY